MWKHRLRDQTDPSLALPTTDELLDLGLVTQALRASAPLPANGDADDS